MTTPIKYRKNPALGTDSKGYLLNAQFSKWAEDNFEGYEYNPNATLWLHATMNYNLEEWLGKENIFNDHHVNFYIGSGANYIFGRNFTFFRYRPTKIFDPMNEEELDSILDASYSFFIRNPDIFEQFRMRVERGVKEKIKEVNYNIIANGIFDPILKESFKLELKKTLQSGDYIYLRYMDDLLREFGYTAYYETEKSESFKGSPEKTNIAVFSEDYKNLEFAGYIKARKFNTPNDRYYAVKELGYDPSKMNKEKRFSFERLVSMSEFFYCPICGVEFFVEDREKFLNQIFKTGFIGCPDCKNKSNAIKNPKKPNEDYIVFHSNDLEETGYFYERYGVDLSAVDPYRLARDLSIGISRDKEFTAGHIHNGELVSALFIDTADCFSFDIVVSEQHRLKGLADELVKIAIFEYEYHKQVFEDAYQGSKYQYCIEVVNPIMKRLLEKKGFYVYEVSGYEGVCFMRRADD